MNQIKRGFLVMGLVFAALGFSSCDTPTGEGAGYGAAGGAVLGAMIGGNMRSAAIGSAAGAGLGALIGAIVQDSDRTRYDREEPRDGYPYGIPTDYRGIVRSPYSPHHLIDVTGIPHGALVMDPTVDRPFVRP
jgi:YMGG-like Gly-zipper